MRIVWKRFKPFEEIFRRPAVLLLAIAFAFPCVASASSYFELAHYETFDSDILDVLKFGDRYEVFHSDVKDDGRSGEITCTGGQLKIKTLEVPGSGHVALLSCTLPVELTVNDTYYLDLGMVEVDQLNWFGCGVGVSYLNQQTGPIRKFPGGRQGYGVAFVDPTDGANLMMVYRHDGSKSIILFGRSVIPGPSHLKNLSIEVSGAGRHMIVFRYREGAMKEFGIAEDTFVFSDTMWVSRSDRIEIWGEESQVGPIVTCDTLIVMVEHGIDSRAYKPMVDMTRRLRR